MTHFHIITLFPEVFEAYLDTSMFWRAKKEKKVNFSLYNPRDYTKDKHKKVDDKPYGGGPGMVLSVDPIMRAVKAIEKKTKGKKTKVILLSPGGKQFDNAYAKKVTKGYEHIILIAGHYEGIDSRVKKILRAEEISIGPYVLTGGELPAMVLIDAMSRQIKGVLGNDESLEENRISSSEMYTRPEVYEHKGKKYKVPKVLLSGNHKDIEEWKQGK